MAIINEENARIAKQLSSFSDYVEGSATASYNAQCAEAAAILEKVKAKCATDEQRERAEYLYNRYCSVLAEAINRDNEIGTRCPSVLVCGAGNFPTRKKEKQIAAWDKNMENFRKADHYLDMLKRAHTLAVKSDDPEVLDYLRAKLDQLQAAHQTMKDANTYYRKHKTLDGCPGVTAKERARLENDHVFGVGSPLALYGCPYLPMCCKVAMPASSGQRIVLQSWKQPRPHSPWKMNTTATPTGRMPKQCVFNSGSTASRTTKPEHFSSATGSGGRRRWVSGSASSTTTASMPPTASWRFWTASSKTDTLTGLHRKAAPPQPARATRHRPRYLYTQTGKSKNSNPYRDER